MKNLAPGLLLAMPQLADPRFHKAVILMLEHSEQGSMGLVINQTGPLTLGELAQGQPLGQAFSVAPSRKLDPIFLGGPVERQRGFILHDQESIAEKQSLLLGLYLSLTMDTLGPLLASSAPSLRFYLGYAGWGPKQLEQEIASGSWLFTEAAAQVVLRSNPSELWEKTLRGIGVEPTQLISGGGLS